MMTDRPIVFSAPMIRALLDGRKSMTRRVLKPQPTAEFIEATISADGLTARPAALFGSETHKALRRVYRPGDHLWVREEYSFDHSWADVPPRDVIPAAPVWYWADGNPEGGDWTKPKPGIHMPRWASRLTLIVTDVRVQRLQDISEEDARAEGVFVPEAQYAQQGSRAPVLAYAGLWEDLNASRGYGWETNPWVVALTFTAHRCNIDQMAEAA
ncbi:MAG TPA: hypothetical protein VFT89_07195 [Rhizobiaceae bacterium]|nr:hypothetical protein [Rhizobiaceae bacterium]